MVWLFRGEAMVKLIPVAIAPHYSGGWVCYLPTKVMVPPMVPQISCVNVQELWVVLMGVWYNEELVNREPSPCTPSGAAGVFHGERSRV